MIFTHTGKLGDFFYCFPIASWWYKTTGRKIHWVLSKYFPPFNKVQSLLECLEFTEKVTLVPFKIDNYELGGQPYNIVPRDFGLFDEYRNFGFRQPPDKFISDFYAEEHGFGVDNDFKLEIPELQESFPLGCTEHLKHKFPSAITIDEDKDVLWNLRRFLSCKEVHCYFSSMAVLLYFSKKKFVLYRNGKHQEMGKYFPDATRIERVEENWN
jgi:hypothetical protein